MNIFILGASHHQTPVEVREKLTAAPLEIGGRYYQYANDGRVRETIVLSTCNRLEILGVAEEVPLAARELGRFLAAAAGLSPDQLTPYLYTYENLEAVRHVFRVAASLDSLVVGEPQILGQVKEAFSRALKNRTAGPVISRLMHRSFRTAKRVRSETSLGGGAVSVASAALTLAETLKGPLTDANIVLLGAGSMAALAAAHLKRRGAGDLVIVNRGLSRARLLAESVGARVRAWDELASALAEADLVLVATGAPAPVLDQRNFPADFRPGLLLIDIGVPRNVSPLLETVPSLTIKNIDDLELVINNNLESRRRQSGRAEEIISEELDKFRTWLAELSTQPTIKRLVDKAEEARRLELRRTVDTHNFTPEQKVALEIMTRSLVRRILHDPLNFIKKCGAADVRRQHRSYDPTTQQLKIIRQAFNLDE